VVAALASAALHAGWNAAVKANTNPSQAMAAQLLVSAGLSVALLGWAGLPPPQAWPWMAGSAAAGTAALTALLRAYERGGFGVVYPISRAASVLLVVPLAGLTTGQWPGALGAAGIGLVSLAVTALAFNTRRTPTVTPHAIGWTLLAAACTAGYLLCDGLGMRHGASPLSYGLSMSVVNAAAFVLLRRPCLTGTGPDRRWLPAIAIAAASTGSYLLILWVWTRAPIALGAALRDTSAVFATLIAVLALKEPLTRPTTTAIALATAGTILIRLG